MSRLPCLQCGRQRGITRTQILVKCKSGWTHYNPDICNQCLQTFEGMLEAVTPMGRYGDITHQLTLMPQR